jgi:hypothetical protein
MADVYRDEGADHFAIALQDYHPRNFSVRLWDGSQRPAETDPIQRPTSRLRQYPRRPLREGAQKYLNRESDNLLGLPNSIDCKPPFASDKYRASPSS